MAKQSFLKAGGLAALAAAIAVTAAPGAASAQDRGHWSGRGQGGQVQAQAQPSGNAGNVWVARQQQRQQQMQQRQVQAQQQQGQWQQRQQVQAQQQGQWQQRRNWNGGQGSAAAAQQWRVRREAQAAGERQSWGNRSGDAATRQQWQGRNRSYADPSRNTGYTGGHHSQWSGDRNRQSYRGDWRRDNRYNWSAYRNQHRDVYRLGRYYSPYNNWSYRRIGIGFGLDSLFYSQRYWIDDPWEYRLPEVDGPYRWVRYYDDVLLVDIYNGEVVDAIYDFFW